MEHFLDYFQPEHYQLDLTISRQDLTLSGTVKITGKPQTKTIKFHAVDMEILEVCYQAINDTVKVDNYLYDNKSLIFDVPTNSSKLEISIKFQTQLNQNMQGCYLSTYEYQKQKQLLVATQFESHYAREAFPCIDEPAAKATFSLSLTIPDLAKKDVVLANMPLKSQAAKTFRFTTTPPMSTYLLAWVVGPLQKVETINRNGIKVSSYGALNQPLAALEFANFTAARALEYFDEKFQIQYPLPKLDQVALPDFEAGAMENWGLVTYRESCLLADEHATLETKKSVAITVTHELSHQWFGDLVTMRWWDDLWLNESFASIMEYYATDALYPEFEIWQDFFTSDCLAALRRDSMNGVQAVQQVVNDPAEIATLFDGAIVYAKGARLVLMLIRMMGERQFYDGMRAYFEKYQYRNTIGDNLWDSLQPYADFNIKQFMHAWISQPGFPLTDTDGNQKRFFINDKNTSKSKSKWPLPKISDDMAGHYLLQLSNQEFQQKLQNFDMLSTEQKLRLLMDYLLLAKTPAAESSSLLDLLPEFIHETSAAIWTLVSTLIADLKLFCPTNTEAAHNLQQYLRQTLHQRWSGADLDSTKLDSNALQVRDILLGIAHYAEAEPTLQDLASRYNPDLTKLDPELRSHIISSKFYFSETEIFSDLLKYYQNTIDPELKSELLFIMASFAKETMHTQKLIELLKCPDIVRPQDHLFLFIYLMRNFYTRDLALDWLINNWQYVEELTGEKSIEDYPRYAAGIICTPEAAKKFFNFFDEKSDNPILSRTLKIAHIDINARLALIARDSAGVHTKLKNLIDG